MAFTCKVGPAQEDVVSYVRNQVEDLSGLSVPDSSFSTKVTRVVRDLTRFYPLSNVVGNVQLATSPLVTVQNQQRYQCTPANGFPGTILKVTDVLYRASGGFSAASEIGYMALLPFSPANAFLFTPSLVDSPSRRIIRNLYLNEIDHYGIGKSEFGRAGILLDSTGTFCIDLYPIPTQAGLPIYVRYSTVHQVTWDGNSPANASVPTLPDAAVRYFQSLLEAMVLKELAVRITQQVDAKAGQIEVKTDPGSLRLLARDVEEQAYLELGVGSGAAETSS